MNILEITIVNKTVEKKECVLGSESVLSGRMDRWGVRVIYREEVHPNGETPFIEYTEFSGRNAKARMDSFIEETYLRDRADMKALLDM